MKLENLQPGQSRKLTVSEVKQLKGDEKQARLQLREFGSENLDLVLAIGDRAATLAAHHWPGPVVQMAGK